MFYNYYFFILVMKMEYSVFKVEKKKDGRRNLFGTAARRESLEIARWRFQKFNSNYIESIKIARRRYPPRDTNFPHWGTGRFT
jgi:hypothetical protein